MKTRGVHCDKKMSENNHLVQGLGCFKIFLRIHYFSTFRNSLLLEVIHNFFVGLEYQGGGSGEATKFKTCPTNGFVGCWSR